MFKKREIRQCVDQLGKSSQFTLKLLVVLILINYMVVTILLQDFVLFKFLRDFVLLLFLAGILFAQKPRLPKGFALLGLFVVSCIPAFLMGVSPALGFTVMRRYLFPLILFFAVYQLNMERHMHSFFSFLLKFLGILAAWGIFQALVLGDYFLMAIGYPTQYLPGPPWESLYYSYYFGNLGLQRVVTTMSNSNACALFLGSSLIFLLLCFPAFHKGKKSTPIFLALIAAAYILTFSRSNFLAMGIVIVLFALPYIPYKKQILIGLAAAAVLFVIIGLIQGENGFFGRLLIWAWNSVTFQETSAAGRSGRWITALIAVLKHPFGMGFGHVGSIAAEAGVVEGYYSCENSFLAVALDTGWLGMLFYMGFVGIQALQLFRYARKFRKAGDAVYERVCMSGLIIIVYFLIVFCFSNHIYDMEPMSIIYLYIAVILPLAHKRANALQAEEKGSSMLEKIEHKVATLWGNIVMAFRSLFWKRKKDTVLFGAWFGDKFADNSRFLYQYLAENKEALGLSHVVWVCRNKELLKELRDMGYEAYHTESPESIHYHKTACIHVVCNSTSDKNNTIPDIDVRYSFGAKRVNLWHGVGVVKGVGCASKEYKRRKAQHKLVYGIKEGLEKCWLYRQFVTGTGGWGNFYFLSPTELDTKQFREFSYIPKKAFIQSQYPRTCPCPKPMAQEKAVLEILKKNPRTVLYLPTFRTGSNAFDFSTLANHLQDVLEKEDILWIQKAHSASKTDLQDRQTKNILNLPPEFDINVIMPYISMLVTDYSSAASDARFFRKPVLFYVPDLEEYTNGDNGVTEEAEELMRGPQYFDLDTFREGLATYIADPEGAKPEDYESIREKYWGKEMELAEIWQDILTKTRLK